MLRRKPPVELGRLLDTHRPLNPFLAWTSLAVMAFVGNALVLLTSGMETVPVPVATAGFVVLLVLFGYAFSLPMLAEHRLYEHGIVFRTAMIGTSIFVVPHHTVQPHSMQAEPKPDSARFEVVDNPLQRRCVRARPSVRLYGLVAEHARLLGKGRLGWADAARQGGGRLPGGTASFSGQADWVADYRDAEEKVSLIQQTVWASHRQFPYYKYES